VLREAVFLVAKVHEIGDTVIVAVRSAGVGDAVILGETWFLGAQVLIISYPIPILVRAAAQPWESGILPTSVVHVSNAVSIRVRATTVFRRAARIEALVINIQDAIPIEVPRRHTTIIAQTGFIRAGIVLIDHPVAIAVGATLG
jgi:hypothetical protein